MSDWTDEFVLRRALDLHWPGALGALRKKTVADRACCNLGARRSATLGQCEAEFILRSFARRARAASVLISAALLIVRLLTLGSRSGTGHVAFR